MGRIAAIVNRSHNNHHKDKTGFFGFFDFIDDPEVSKKLLETAEEKLRSLGFETIRGPCNPSINDECGLLISGFDRPPFIMMVYNPPYYLTHYENLGLKLKERLFAFYISSETAPPARIEKIVNRVRSRNKVTLRSIQLSKLKDELRIIHRLYNQTIGEVNWGSIPIDYEDLEAFASDLKAFADPAIVLIAEVDGRPVGFSLALPDINQFLLQTKKLPRFLRILVMAFKIFTQRPTEARLIILGVEPEYRNKGIGSLFYYETLIRGRERYKGGELSWVDEQNEEMVRAIETMGGQLYKTYGLFERPVKAV